jgi:hypothetical protein
MGDIGAGTRLEFSDTDGTGYTAVGTLRSVGMPKVSVNKVERKNHDMADLTTQYLPGWLDPGEIDGEIEYDGTQCSTLYAIVGVEKYWQITLPDGGEWSFAGFISEFDGESPIDGLMTTKIKLQPTTKPAFSAGS